MELHYPHDIEAVARIPDDQKEAFEKWMAELEAEYIKRGKPYGDETAARATGVECWIGYFEDEYSPAEALDEDLSYAADDAD
jgi:hypothetical protein